MIPYFAKIDQNYYYLFLKRKERLVRNYRNSGTRSKKP